MNWFYYKTGEFTGHLRDYFLAVFCEYLFIFISNYFRAAFGKNKIPHRRDFMP